MKYLVIMPLLKPAEKLLQLALGSSDCKSLPFRSPSIEMIPLTHGSSSFKGEQMSWFTQHAELKMSVWSKTDIRWICMSRSTWVEVVTWAIKMQALELSWKVGFYGCCQITWNSMAKHDLYSLVRQPSSQDSFVYGFPVDEKPYSFFLFSLSLIHAYLSLKSIVGKKSVCCVAIDGCPLPPSIHLESSGIQNP